MVDDDEPPFTHHLKVRPYRGIEKALDRHNELLATIAAQAAELEALRGEVSKLQLDRSRLDCRYAGPQGTFMQGADKPRLFTDPPSSLTTWGMGVPAFDTDKKDD